MATRSRWLGSALGACSIIAAANIVPTARAFGATNTPIKHVVVIFQENESFDHYFGTYPDAENNKNETPFTAANNTPTVNGLTDGLIQANNNSDKNGVVYPPFRLSPSQNYTCDM